MPQNDRTMGYLSDYENIGGHIDRALKKRNHTQVWLSEQLGIDKTHVNKWVNNHIRPSAKYLNEIAKALDYDVSEIITGHFKDERTYRPMSVETKATEDGSVYNEELHLIEIYLDRIIESKSDSQKLVLKSKLMNLLGSIL